MLPWANGNPTTGTEGSYPGFGLFTDAQEEILAAIQAAGLTPSGTLTQLAQSIPALSTKGLLLGWGQNTLNPTPGTYTWTVPDGVFWIWIWMVAGGGGGAGGITSTLSGGGGGAGAGAWVRKAVTPGQVVTVVTGAGGTNGVPSASSSVGGNGGSTTVSIPSVFTLTCAGGQGGVNGGAGGGGSGSAFGSVANSAGVSGGSGSPGQLVNGATYVYGGTGATSMFGGGGGSVQAATALSGAAPGSGGGGGAIGSGGTAYYGGAGAPGLVLIGC